MQYAIFPEPPAFIITPTANQQAVYDFVRDDVRNAVINAVAGSGKSTTIVTAVKYIPKHKVIYFLAFNVDIVTELKKKLPKYVNVMTLHSLGAKALYAAYRGTMNNNKAFKVIDNLKESWYMDDVDRDDAEYPRRVKKLVDLYRLTLCQSIDQLYELSEKHNIEITNGECKRAIEVVNIMNENKKEYDYIDMLYQPAIDPKIKFPIADFVFIDECQDLNAAQQNLFQKLLRKQGSRFIAVGDPYQAIYGFAGADDQSFNKLKQIPNTIELPLNESFRCCSSVIELAQQIVPHIKAAPNAKKGVVNLNDSYLKIADGDMVLCRNVAPLVKMCLEFIRKGQKAYVKGGDIGKTMIDLINSSKSYNIPMLMDYLTERLYKIFKSIAEKHTYLEDDQVMEFPAYVLFNEKKNVIQSIIDYADVRTIGDIVKWIEEVFSDEKTGICLSSIHKSKGLENDRIFIIEPSLMPSAHAKLDWQLIQEENLRYVAFTRAKNYLGFVEDWSFKKERA